MIRRSVSCEGKPKIIRVYLGIIASCNSIKIKGYWSYGASWKAHILSIGTQC